MRWRRGAHPTIAVDHSSDLGQRDEQNLDQTSDICRRVDARTSSEGTITGMTNGMCGESLSAVITKWCQWQATTCNDSTISQRLDVIERLREHAAVGTGRDPAEVDPRHLDAEDVAAYLARPLSANSKAMYARSLASWFGWLHRTGRIAADPMVQVGRARGRIGIPNPLTLEEVERVFDGAALRLWAMMALALYAGLRAHEVAAFRGDRIRGRQVVLVGKGNKDARLPLAGELAALAPRMPGGWWFPAPRSEFRPHLAASYIGELVSDRFRSCGIPTGSIHRLRHTYGTLVHREHRDVLVTRRLLRHASVATTMIYTDVEPADLVSALEGLPSLSA